MSALTTAATGMSAQELNVSIIAHNIANMNTAGFKRKQGLFADLVYQDHRTVGTQASNNGNILPSGMQTGLGVKPIAVYTVMEAGPVTMNNDNPFSIYIQGNGFLQVAMPDGTMAYTRAGLLQLNQDRQLVTVDGFPIEPAIIFPDSWKALTINPNGEFSVLVEGQTASVIIGTLELANFPNPAGLTNLGDNLLRPNDASGTAMVGIPGTLGLGTILQSAYEGSNVNAVNEITNLILAQRGYELNSKVIQTADEMLSTITRK